MSFATAAVTSDLRVFPPGHALAGAQVRLHNVPASEPADVFQFGERRTFVRNESIFKTGTSASHVYRVVSGTVRMCRYVENGRFILDFAFPSELVGFTNRPRHNFDAEAVTDCTLVAYPRAQLDAVMSTTPSVNANILSQMTDNTLNAQQHLLSIGCQDAKQRLAGFLVRILGRTGVQENEALYLPMKRRDIADHLALCTETTCRALRALKAENMIEIPNTHEIVVKDLARLRALACLDYRENGHA